MLTLYSCEINKSSRIRKIRFVSFRKAKEISARKQSDEAVAGILIVLSSVRAEVNGVFGG